MNREAAVILALAALTVAAVLVSVASWVHLWGERRRSRNGAGIPEGPGEDREAP